MEGAERAHTAVPLLKQDESSLAELWKQFLSEYPTTEHFLAEFYTLANINVSSCSRCRSTNVVLEYGMRILRCKSCRKEYWPCKDTFFDHSKRPHLWIGAVWLLQNGAALTAARFQRLVKVAYSSASLIFKRATIFAESQMKSEESPEISSAHFLSLFAKRSSETPARSHPKTEEPGVIDESASSKPETASTGFPGEDSARSNDSANSEAEHNSTYTSPTNQHNNSDDGCNFHFNEQQSRIWDHLSQEPQSTEVLHAKTDIEMGELLAQLLMMELAGAIRSSAGSKYSRAKQFQSHSNMIVGELSDEWQKLVDTLFSYVKSYSGTISRKYLQNIVTAGWCHLGRNREANPSLVEACYLSPPIRYRDVLRYVTRAAVKVWQADFD